MDLTTYFMGFELPHPFIVGASPFADTSDSLRRVEDAGAAAIVMRSVFEEQITAEELATHRATEPHAESFAEALSYFPEPAEFVLGEQEYLEQIRKAKEAVDIPVIGSLNGSTLGGWLEYARSLEQSGADAIELNPYDVATDSEETGEAIESRVLEIVREVKESIRVPVAVKLSPFYTSLANFAKRVDEAGADGLVLFNRFFEPDIDVEELEVRSHLELSNSSELLLRLRWLAILSGRLEASLAITGGVHTALDAIKALMCGAQAVQIVSVLLRHGPHQLETIRREMVAWMEEHEYESLEQMIGSMNLERCPRPRMFERANYIHLLQTWQPT
jgi:dihydroorotate dehydrogenase (fumarate)